MTSTSNNGQALADLVPKLKHVLRRAQHAATPPSPLTLRLRALVRCAARTTGQNTEAAIATAAHWLGEAYLRRAASTPTQLVWETVLP